MPFEIDKDLETAIEEIAEAGRAITMNKTIRDIQKEVRARLGYEPSTATVSRVLKRLGIVNHEGRHSWKWLKKPEAE